jgi:pilus assembly protein CpaF
VDQLLARRLLPLTPAQRERIIGTIVDEIVGLGHLESLLSDPSVSDILVNGAETIYIERHGVLEQTVVRFRDNDHLLTVINRIVARIGRRIDESSPMVDGRLADGSRINAVIPPLALDGPLLCIRRFGTGPTAPEELVSSGTLSPSMFHFLRCAVQAKCNLIISGGTGAGKTTLLNALSSLIPAAERVITIEDAAELRLQQAHVVRMETRPANLEGRGEVTIRQLMRNALRMRPDRIIVGEVRSAEVLDMIQAMNTGHEGSMTTVHANSAEDAITRLMSMFAMGGSNLTEKMILTMIWQSIHFIVYIKRFPDGQRRITMVAELEQIRDGRLQLRPLFEFRQEELSDGCKSRGQFITRETSRLLDRFRTSGRACCAS